MTELDSSVIHRGISYLGQKFWLDTPRTDSSLRRKFTQNLLKFTTEYICTYPSVPIPLGIDTEK